MVKQVLSLFIAQRRPTELLLRYRDALNEKCNSYIRLLAAEGILSPRAAGSFPFAAPSLSDRAPSARPDEPGGEKGRKPDSQQSAFHARCGTALRPGQNGSICKNDPGSPHADYDHPGDPQAEGSSMAGQERVDGLSPSRQGGPREGDLQPCPLREHGKREPPSRSDRQLRPCPQHQRRGQAGPGVHGQTEDPRPLSGDHRSPCTENTAR